MLDRLQKQIDQTQRWDDTSPLAHGWVFAYRHEGFDNQPVFTQGNAKLMCHPVYKCWFVQIGDKQAEPVDGNIKEVTEKTLKELSK